MLLGVLVRDFSRFGAWAGACCDGSSSYFKGLKHDKLIENHSLLFTPVVNTCFTDVFVHIESHVRWAGVRQNCAGCGVTKVISCTVCKVRHSYTSSTWYI